MDIEQQEVRLPGESSGQKKRPQRPADGQRTGAPRKPAPRPDGAAPRKKRPAAEGGAARPARSTSGAGERSAAPKKRPAASESGTRFADEAPAKRPASRTAGGSRPAAEGPALRTCRMRGRQNSSVISNLIQVSDEHEGP